MAVAGAVVVAPAAESIDTATAASYACLAARVAAIKIKNKILLAL